MEQAGLRDIKPPLFFKADYTILIIILALIIIAAAALLIIYLLKKRQHKKPKETIPPKKAHEIAYELLNRLKAKNLPASGRVKEYYFEISKIVRSYIENRFSLKAPEMTTEEFLYSLKDSGILSGAQKNLVKEFLSQCDMVKFAKYGPTEEEIDTSFTSAKRLVDETKLEEKEQADTK